MRQKKHEARLAPASIDQDEHTQASLDSHEVVRNIQHLVRSVRQQLTTVDRLTFLYPQLVSPLIYQAIIADMEDEIAALRVTRRG